MAKNEYRPDTEPEALEEAAPVADKPEAPKKRLLRLSDIIVFMNKDQMIVWMPYIFFAAGLAFVYITNSYYAERNIRKIDKIGNELKELRSEYITGKSELMFKSKQSEVAKQLEATGVVESTEPPKKIIIKKKEKIY